MGCMDRAHLEAMLSQNHSLAEIGKRVGLHEATVGYWVKKYDLKAVHKTRHAARGTIARERLERLIEAGLSIAQIALETNRSKATVRHWLISYGLKTHGALGRRSRVDARLAREVGVETIRLRCARHGETDFWLDKRGYYRCKRCRSAAVARRRRKMKQILVEEAGGACCVCGYDRNMRALHFHHLEPSRKRREINARGTGIALDRLREEARKCVLLCANCHAEVEAGLIALAPGKGPPYNAA